MSLLDDMASKRTIDKPSDNPDQEESPEEKLKPSYTHKSALERLDLMKNQDILDEAKNYYIELQGKPKEFTLKHKKSKYLNYISPHEMTEALKLLDIKFTEKRLHWIAQFYYVLEIPPFWNLKRAEENKFLFHYRGTKINGRQEVEMEMSPAVHYLDSIIEEFRQTFFPEELTIDEVENLKKFYIYNDPSKKLPKKYTVETCEQINKDWNLNYETRGKPMKYSESGYWKRYWYERKKGKAYFLGKEEKDYPITEDQAVYDTDQKKRGGWSNYIYYKPSGTLPEQKMEALYQDQINKELAEKREAEEFQHFMKNWADGKSRYETEIQRKMGQKYSGSQCEKRSAYHFDPKAHRIKQPNSNFDNTRMNRITSAYQTGGKITTLPTRPMTAGINNNLKGSNDDATRLPSAYSLTRPLTAFGAKSGQNWGSRPQTATSTMGGTLNIRKGNPNQLPQSREFLKSANQLKTTGSANLQKSKLDFERKVMSGYYKDLNNEANQEGEEYDEEYYNEIQEDDEDISDQDEEYLDNLEKDPAANMPHYVEVDYKKRPMSVCTTVHHEYKNFVPPAPKIDPKKKKKPPKKKKKQGGGKKKKKAERIPTIQIVQVLGNNKLEKNEGLQIGEKLKEANDLHSEKVVKDHIQVPCTVNFINKSEHFIDVFYVDAKKEKNKVLEIEPNTSKRHKGMLGHQFICEFEHQQFAAYKIPKDLDITNAGAVNQETGVVIEDDMEVEAGNIENILPTEERMATQKIRDTNAVTCIEHDEKDEHQNKNTLSVWGKVPGNPNTTNNGEYASNFSTVLHPKPNKRPFSAFTRNDNLNLERDEQLRELDQIKQRMNSNMRLDKDGKHIRMFLPMQTIEKAILNPVQDIPVHRVDIAQPRPGSGLISNPKFKKKGKKKKRGRSRKK